MTLEAWPGMMKRGTAAAYCDLSIAEFEREVAAGRLPQPVMLGRHDHWSKVQLDKSLAVITGEEEEDWRRGSPLYESDAA